MSSIPGSRDIRGSRRGLLPRHKSLLSGHHLPPPPHHSSAKQNQLEECVRPMLYGQKRAMSRTSNPPPWCLTSTNHQPSWKFSRETKAQFVSEQQFGVTFALKAKNSHLLILHITITVRNGNPAWGGEAQNFTNFGLMPLFLCSGSLISEHIYILKSGCHQVYSGTLYCKELLSDFYLSEGQVQILECNRSGIKVLTRAD